MNLCAVSVPSGRGMGTGWEMVSLAEHHSCIFPWEMERAAEHLAAGGGIQDILPMSVEGLLEGCPDQGQEETPVQSM